mmetsp:Transcript_1181/g.2517  ORF Transcript_1181/g.2517 Transcript_1181/m.2517 type:complete len:224 (+) Transcript_1181:1205-1876(+)
MVWDRPSSTVRRSWRLLPSPHSDANGLATEAGSCIGSPTASSRLGSRWRGIRSSASLAAAASSTIQSSTLLVRFMRDVPAVLSVQNTIRAVARSSGTASDSRDADARPDPCPFSSSSWSPLVSGSSRRTARSSRRAYRALDKDSALPPARHRISLRERFAAPEDSDSRGRFVTIRTCRLRAFARRSPALEAAFWEGERSLSSLQKALLLSSSTSTSVSESLSL